MEQPGSTRTSVSKSRRGSKGLGGGRDSLPGAAFPEGGMPRSRNPGPGSVTGRSRMGPAANPGLLQTLNKLEQESETRAYELINLRTLVLKVEKEREDALLQVKRLTEQNAELQEEVVRLNEEVSDLNREKTHWRVGEWLDNASGLSHIRAAAAAATATAAVAITSAPSHTAAATAGGHTPPASTPPRSTIIDASRTSAHSKFNKPGKCSRDGSALQRMPSTSSPFALAARSGGPDGHTASHGLDDHHQSEMEQTIAALRAQVKQLEADLAAVTAGPGMQRPGTPPAPAKQASDLQPSSLKDVVLARDGSAVLVADRKTSRTGSRTPERLTDMGNMNIGKSKSMLLPAGFAGQGMDSAALRQPSSKSMAMPPMPDTVPELQDALAKLTSDREEQQALRQVEVQHLRYTYQQQLQERDQLIESLREQLMDAQRRVEQYESLVTAEGLTSTLDRPGSACSDSQQDMPSIRSGVSAMHVAGTSSVVAGVSGARASDLLVRTSKNSMGGRRVSNGGCTACARLQEQVEGLRRQLAEAHAQGKAAARTTADLAAQLAGGQAQLADAQMQAQAAVRSAADLAEQVAKLSKGRGDGGGPGDGESQDLAHAIVQNLRKEIAQMAADLDEKGVELLAARNEAEQVRTELNQAGELTASSMAALTTARAELDSAKQAATQAQEEVNKVQAELTRIQSELATFKAETATSKAEAVQALADLTLSKAELATSKAELVASKAEAQRLQVELATAQADLGHAHDDHGQMRQDATQLRSDLTQVRADLTQVRTDCEEARTDASRARTELQASVDQLTSAKQHVTEMQLALVAAQKQVADTDGQLAELQHQLIAAQKLSIDAQKKVVELQGALKEAQVKCDDAQKESVEAQASLKEAQKQLVENKQMVQSVLMDKDSAAASKDVQIANLQQQLVDLRQLHQLQMQPSGMLAKEAAVAAVSAPAEAATVAARVQELEQQLAAAQAQLEAAAAAAAADKQVEEMQAKLTAAQMQLTDVQAMLDARQAQLTAVTAQSAAQQAQLAAAQAHLAESQVQIVAAQAQLPPLQEQLSQRQTQLVTMQAQLTAQQEQLVIAERQLADQETQVSSRDRRLGDLQQQLEDQKDRLAESGLQYQQLHLYFQEVAGLAGAASAASRQHQATVAQLKGELQASHVQAQASAEVVAGLEEKLEEKVAEKNRVSNEVSKQLAKIVQLELSLQEQQQAAAPPPPPPSVAAVAVTPSAPSQTGKAPADTAGVAATAVDTLPALDQGKLQVQDGRTQQDEASASQAELQQAQVALELITAELQEVRAQNAALQDQLAFGDTANASHTVELKRQTNQLIQEVESLRQQLRTAQDAQAAAQKLADSEKGSVRGLTTRVSLLSTQVTQFNAAEAVRQAALNASQKAQQDVDLGRMEANELRGRSTKMQSLIREMASQMQSLQVQLKLQGSLASKVQAELEAVQADLDSAHKEARAAQEDAQRLQDAYDMACHREAVAAATASAAISAVGTAASAGALVPAPPPSSARGPIRMWSAGRGRMVAGVKLASGSVSLGDSGASWPSSPGVVQPVTGAVGSWMGVHVEKGAALSVPPVMLAASKEILEGPTRQEALVLYRRLRNLSSIYQLQLGSALPAKPRGGGGNPYPGHSPVQLWSTLNVVLSALESAGTAAAAPGTSLFATTLAASCPTARQTVNTPQPSTKSSYGRRSSSPSSPSRSTTLTAHHAGAAASPTTVMSLTADSPVPAAGGMVSRRSRPGSAPQISKTAALSAAAAAASATAAALSAIGVADTMAVAAGDDAGVGPQGGARVRTLTGLPEEPTAVVYSATIANKQGTRRTKQSLPGGQLQRYSNQGE